MSFLCKSLAAVVLSFGLILGAMPIGAEASTTDDQTTQVVKAGKGKGKGKFKKGGKRSKGKRGGKKKAAANA